MTKSLTRMQILYWGRMLLRTAVLILTVLLYFLRPEAFLAARGEFFTRLSPMHLLWALWMVDMIFQLFPSKGLVAMGCQKMFPTHYRPTNVQPSPEEWRAWKAEKRRGARLVAISWLALAAVIAVFRFAGVLRARELVILSALFYVCDLICVLIWCPFQKLMMKNRCCTTCRIFNWDHLMMFTPMAFLGSFFAMSLFVMSVVVLVVWEIQYVRHPEYFWEKTNAALKCANCQEQLCSLKRYCRAKARSVGDKATAAAASAAAAVSDKAASVTDKASQLVENTAEAVAETAEAVREAAETVSCKKKMKAR